MNVYSRYTFSDLCTEYNILVFLVPYIIYDRYLCIYTSTTLASFNSDRKIQKLSITCPTARATIILLLREKNWSWLCHVVVTRTAPSPQVSCYLTPLDFFLWNYVKTHGYENKPQTIEELNEEICRAIGKLDPEMCDGIFCDQNWSFPA